MIQNNLISIQSEKTDTHHWKSSYLGGTMAGLVLLLYAMQAFSALDLSKWPPQHQTVILDQDATSDQDDVGAHVLVHKFADFGVIDFIGMGLSVPQTGKYSAPNVVKSADAINTYYGRPNVPLGVVKHTTANFSKYPNLAQSEYNEYLATHFPNDIDTSKVPEACELYKQLLAEQPDTSVTFIVTGYPTNLAQLISTPEGMALARKKVKIVVWMAGWNEACCSFQEGNIMVDPPSSKLVIDSFPSPIIFSGFNVGHATGGVGFKNLSDKNPARWVYNYKGYNVNAWDPEATLFALGGVGPAGAYFKTHTLGYNTYNESTGLNQWIDTDVPSKRQAYINEVDVNKIRSAMDSIFAIPPTPTTGTAPLSPTNKIGLVKVTVGNGVIQVTGIHNGTLTLFDLTGRTCQEIAIKNGQGSLKSHTQPNARVFFYSLKKGSTVVARGKMAIR